MSSPMAGTPAQLVLDLPHRQALGADDFLVSRSNAAALALVDGWPGWPTSAVIVTGPPGSGKTHLVQVWRARSAGLVLPASEVTDAVVAAFPDSAAVAVEDLDRGPVDEQLLFHLLNRAREHRLSLLLTAGKAPGEMGITLPDLRSRVRALPHAAIEAPDDGLIGALIVKLFEDRQLRVEPHVVAYIVRHLDRTTEAVQRVVALVDRLALAAHRRVTRALASEALAALQSGGLEDDG